jgi:hypothetical protein
MVLKIKPVLSVYALMVKKNFLTPVGEQINLKAFYFLPGDYCND